MTKEEFERLASENQLLKVRSSYQTYLVSKSDPLFGVKPDVVSSGFSAVVELSRLSRIDLWSVLCAIADETARTEKKALSPAMLVEQAKDIYRRFNVKIERDVECARCLGTGFVSLISSAEESRGCVFAFRCSLCEAGLRLCKKIPMDNAAVGFVEYSIENLNLLKKRVVTDVLRV